MVPGFLIGRLIRAALLEEDTSHVVMHLKQKKIKRIRLQLRHLKVQGQSVASTNLTVQLVGTDAQPRSRGLRRSVGCSVGGQQVQSPHRVHVEVFLQLQGSFQDADGVSRLLFQLRERWLMRRFNLHHLILSTS